MAPIVGVTKHKIVEAEAAELIATEMEKQLKVQILHANASLVTPKIGITTMLYRFDSSSSPSDRDGDSNADRSRPGCCYRSHRRHIRHRRDEKGLSASRR